MMSNVVVIFFAMVFAILLMVKFELVSSVQAQMSSTPTSQIQNTVDPLNKNGQQPGSLPQTPNSGQNTLSSTNLSQMQTNSNMMPQLGIDNTYIDPKEIAINELLVGERNPFIPPRYILELEYSKPMDSIDDRMEAIRRWPLVEYSLVGVIWDVNNPRAMIKDRAGTLHILKKNNRIGNEEGVVSQINEGEIVVVEKNIPKILTILKKTFVKSNLNQQVDNTIMRNPTESQMIMPTMPSGR